MRTVEIQVYTHSGGTKDYVLVTLMDDQGESTLMRRNGSLNARGQMQRASAGEMEYVAKERDAEASKRARKDYRQSYQKMFTSAVEFQSEFRGSPQKWADPGTKIHDEIIMFLQGQSAAVPEPEPELSDEEIKAIEDERDAMSDVW